MVQSPTIEEKNVTVIYLRLNLGHPNKNDIISPTSEPNYPHLDMHI